MKQKDFKEIANQGTVICPHCEDLSCNTMRIVYYGDVKKNFGKYVCNDCGKTFILENN